MNSSARQQAYDRGHTIFSPDGRLYQVEYARKAVERGSPSVGVRIEGGVVLAARKRIRSPLLEPETVEKIHRVDEHVAVASAGHAADARTLVEVARERAQRHRLRYGEPIGVESLTTAVANHVQEYTQVGGSRPFGAALLVAGIDAVSLESPTAGSDSGHALDPNADLFEIDPSGTPYGWRATAIGDGAGEVRERFERTLEDDTEGSKLGRADGISLALSGLEAVSEEPLLPSAVAVHVVDRDGLEALSTDTITPLLEDE